MKKTNKIVAIIGLTIMLISTVSNSAFANYQANGNGGKNQKLQAWIGSIRNMEAEGQVMGLTEEINDDLTSTTSNNIDVHQIKNTEWGAIAILSASLDYGKKPTNPNDLTTRYVFRGVKTTTGNAYGIQLYDSHDQWTATDTVQNKWSGADDRYINTYDYYDYVAKDGDAMYNYWHGDSNGSTMLDNYNSSYVRGWNSMFHYWGRYSYTSGDHQTRACIVCGQGY